MVCFCLPWVLTSSSRHTHHIILKMTGRCDYLRLKSRSRKFFQQEKKLQFHFTFQTKEQIVMYAAKTKPTFCATFVLLFKKNTRFDFACWICLDASLKQSSLWIKISRLENRIAQVENWFIPIIPLKDILNYILEVEKVKPMKKVSLCQKTPFVRILKGIKKEL